MEYHSTMRKKEILLFAATWMELEGIVQDEQCQRGKEKYGMVSFVCGL